MVQKIEEKIREGQPKREEVVDQPLDLEDVDIKFEGDESAIAGNKDLFQVTENNNNNCIKFESEDNSCKGSKQLLSARQAAVDFSNSPRNSQKLEEGTKSARSNVYTKAEHEKIED